MTVVHYADLDGNYLGAFDELSKKPDGIIVPAPPDGRAIWKDNRWYMHSVLQAQQEASRRVAYVEEADPLFFKWQAGEATEEEWKAKRQEIRDRFPYQVV